MKDEGQSIIGVIVLVTVVVLALVGLAAIFNINVGN